MLLKYRSLAKLIFYKIQISIRDIKLWIVYSHAYGDFEDRIRNVHTFLTFCCALHSHLTHSLDCLFNGVGLGFKYLLRLFVWSQEGLSIVVLERTKAAIRSQIGTTLNAMRQTMTKKAGLSCYSLIIVKDFLLSHQKECFLDKLYSTLS